MSLKRVLYGLAIISLIGGLIYVVLIFESPDCGDVEPCEPTRASAAVAVVVLSLMIAYVARAVGNRR